METGTGVGNLGKTEVDDLGKTIAGHHDVFRFQVAMDNTCGVGLRETFGNLMTELDRPAEWNRTCLQQLAQRATVHPLHREVGDVVLTSDVVDRQDVRMVEG